MGYWHQQLSTLEFGPFDKWIWRILNDGDVMWHTLIVAKYYALRLIVDNLIFD